MKSRAMFYLALVALVIPTYAGDLLPSPEIAADLDTPQRAECQWTGDFAEVDAPSVGEIEADTAGEASGHPWVQFIDALGEGSVYSSTAGADENRPEPNSGCYTGCFDSQQSGGYCPPGQLAEVTYSGSVNRCYIADLRCVTSCSGPTPSCVGFSPYC